MSQSWTQAWRQCSQQIISLQKGVASHFHFPEVRVTFCLPILWHKVINRKRFNIMQRRHLAFWAILSLSPETERETLLLQPCSVPQGGRLITRQQEYYSTCRTKWICVITKSIIYYSTRLLFHKNINSNIAQIMHVTLAMCARKTEKHIS